VTDSSPNANTVWARELVDELARLGLTHVCISPGSRSTPLVVQFARHPAIKDLSIIDERSAAFVALGLAQSTRQPVGLVCTSGTAAANYYPAVCEASHANVPLLVMTADRPPQRRDTGSPQSMDQTRLYGSHVRWFHELDRPEADPDQLRYLRSTLDLAWTRTKSPTPGPVHLNMPFRKPLEPLAVPSEHRDGVPADFEAPTPPGNEPFTRHSIPTRSPSSETVGRFADVLAEAERPMFFCGADLRGERYRETLATLAERIEAPVLAEPTSQLRFWSRRPEGVLTAGDYLMAAVVREELGHPDVVVRTGRPPLTWEGRRFSRELPEATRQITIHPDEQRPDPDHAVDWHISAEVDSLAANTLARLEETSHSSEEGWLDGHLRAEACAVKVMGEALPSDEPPLDEPSLWPTLLGLLPAGASLFVSNSMPTRTLDMFGLGTPKDLSVYFNRGLNGIDGIESTGAGIALESQGPTVAIMGDVAFRHDIGGLSTAHRLDADIVYVVIDNGGGGIFDRLPIADFDDVHERHFATAPDLDIPGASRGLGAACRQPDTWSEFRGAMDRAIDEGGVQVVVVDTDRHHDKSLGESLRGRLIDSMVDTLST
jgi:2-succinyl-5-enolpyruvyl-6-hydroxy-3-cyclohexene-1-carboxylate synthase